MAKTKDSKRKNAIIKYETVGKPMVVPYGCSRPMTLREQLQRLSPSNVREIQALAKEEWDKFDKEQEEFINEEFEDNESMAEDFERSGAKYMDEIPELYNQDPGAGLSKPGQPVPSAPDSTGSIAIGDGNLEKPSSVVPQIQGTPLESPTT